MPAKSEETREVIAHFEAIWLIISVVLWIFLAWFWPILRHSAFDDPRTWHQSRLVIGTFFLPVILLVWAVALARRVRAGWANRWVGLWIKNGRLVHAQRKTLDVSLGDISSVEIVTEYMSSYYAFRKIPMRLIVITVNDGKPAKLAVSGFHEPADEIVSRIRRHIAPQAESAAA